MEYIGLALGDRLNDVRADPLDEDRRRAHLRSIFYIFDGNRKLYGCEIIVCENIIAPMIRTLTTHAGSGKVNSSDLQEIGERSGYWGKASLI